MRTFHFSYPREPNNYNKNTTYKYSINLDHITHVNWKAYNEDHKAAIYVLGEKSSIVIEGEENLKRLRKTLRIREEKVEAKISDGFKR